MYIDVTVTQSFIQSQHKALCWT